MLSEQRFVQCNLHLTDAKLADELGRTKRAVSKFRRRQGIMKDPEWAAAAKRIWQERHA